MRNEKCPDASFEAQTAWLQSQLLAIAGAARVRVIDAGEWKLTLPAQDGGRRQRVYATALEDVRGAADMYPSLPEPCVQLISPFLVARKGRGLTVDAARRALKYSARADHLRIAWTNHPDGSGAPVLAATHTLFFEDLDTLELADALEEVSRHADRLEQMFSQEDVG